MGGDLRQALALYDWNTRASAAVLDTSAMVEVIVRNALDVSLQQWADRRRGGQDWLDAAPFDAQGRADVVKARDRAAHHEPIHRRDLARDLRDAVDVTGWAHPQGAIWVRARSTLLRAAAERAML